MHRITTSEDAASLAAQLRRLLDAHAEWLCTETVAPARTAHKAETRTKKRREAVRAYTSETIIAEVRDISTPLRPGECDVRVEHGRLLFSYWSERGAHVWRVVACEANDARLSLHVERGAGRERAVLTIAARPSFADAAADIAAARLAACARLAIELRDRLDKDADGKHGGRATIESLRLNQGTRRGEPGRFARIILTTTRTRICATGCIADLERVDPDAFIASALLWFIKAGEASGKRTRSRGGQTSGASRVNHLWLIATKHVAALLSARRACLREGLRELVSVWEADEDFATLAPEPLVKLDEWLDDATGVSSSPNRAAVFAAKPFEPSESANSIAALAPDAIDIIRQRHGETLRFHGLAFARVRRLMNREHIWFGVEGAPPAQARRKLVGDDWTEVEKLVDELAVHRHHAADNKRHALYTTAAESWLESLLRRQVTRLDPGLILAPLHAQFRLTRPPAGNGYMVARHARPIDLLALRRDGRLVVIELKTSEDAALPFQAADYWRQTEAHRRAGHLRAARLFGDKEIADLPPLVYVVAPGLRFASSFATLARFITPEIEMYRFDINEDWRAGVRVMRRVRVN